MRRSQNQQQQFNFATVNLPSAFIGMAPAAFDDMEIEASPLFALGLCLDSSPLYYLAVAKRLQELHELSSSGASDDEEIDDEQEQPQINTVNGANHTRPNSSANNRNVASSPSSATVVVAQPPAEPTQQQLQDIEAFRMSPRAVDDLFRLLTGSGALPRSAVSYDGDVKIDALKTLQVGLRYLGSHESLESLAEEFGFSTPATARRLIQSTVKAVAAVATQLIYWPTKRDAAQRQADLLFTNSFGLSGTVGVIGWAQLSPLAYLQAVVDHRLHFIDAACIMAPGDDEVANLHGSICQQSSLFRKLSSDSARADLLPDNVHILAPQLRAATPSPVDWLVARYLKTPQTTGERLLTEKAFNKHVCHVASVTVQEAFRQLIRRFPRLSVLAASGDDALDDIKTAVLAASVLHNFCTGRKETLPRPPTSHQHNVSLPLSNKSTSFTTIEPASSTSSSSANTEGTADIKMDRRDKIAQEMTTKKATRSRSKKLKK